MKNDQLNSLFEEWEAKKRPNVFCRDGIIDEREYEKQSRKVLFIAKEANGTDHEEGDEHDFRKEWRYGKPEYRVAKRVAEWSYGILKDFPNYDSVVNPLDMSYLQKVAYMNLKKIPGGNRTNNKEFIGCVENDIDFIKKQIAIIAPNIIMLCTSRNRVLRSKLFGDDNWKETGYLIEYAIKEGVLIIDFYHLAAQGSIVAYYSLLQKVFEMIRRNEKNRLLI